jgi:hypothetical protein
MSSVLSSQKMILMEVTLSNFQEKNQQNMSFDSSSSSSPSESLPRDLTVKKKPGRKPASTEATDKRTALNRAAQRAFRERKQKYIEELEHRVKELEEKTRQLDPQKLEKRIRELEEENQQLKQSRLDFVWPPLAGLSTSATLLELPLAFPFNCLSKDLPEKDQ